MTSSLWLILCFLAQASRTNYAGYKPHALNTLMPQICLTEMASNFLIIIAQAGDASSSSVLDQMTPRFRIRPLVWVCSYLHVYNTCIQRVYPTF